MDQTFDLSSTRTSWRGIRVDSARATDTKLVLLVEDERETHRVVFTRDDARGAIRLACTCPSMVTCDHVDAAREVASAHAGMARWLKETAAAAEQAVTAGGGIPAPPLRSAPPARPPAPARPSEPLDDQLARVWELWVEALEAVAQTRVRAPEPARKAPEPIVYVVTRAAEEAGLVVTAWRCRRKKSGEPTPTRKVTLASALRSKASSIPVEDMGLIAELARLAEGNWATDVGLEAEHWPLLVRLVESGRCRVGSVRGPVLAVGEPRAGKLEWRSDDGAQEPGVAIEGGGDVVLFDEPKYFDAERGEIGTLRLPVTCAVADMFLTGPPLMPEQAARLSAADCARMVKLGLPAPQRLKVGAVESVAPTPRLVLYTLARRNPFTADVEATDGASLTFRYGGEEVAGSDDDDELTAVEGDVIRRFARRRDVEAATAKTLAGLGFRPILDVVSRKEGFALRVLLAREHDVGDLTLARGDGDAAEAAWRKFVQQDRPGLLRQGWEVEIDRSFRHAAIEVERWVAQVTPSATVGWFDLDLGVEFGGERLPLLPVLLRLLREDNALLQQALAGTGLAVELPDGRRVSLPVARLKQIVDLVTEMQVGGRLEKTTLRLPQAMVERAAALERHVDGFTWGGTELRALAERLASFERVERVPPPPGLRADLRGYQRDGLAWLQFLCAHGLGGVLADDMGLGKTVQALAHVLTEKAAGRLDRPALVVSPTSVVRNWAAEAARFAPELRVLVLHGLQRKTAFAQMGEHDLVLTTYPLIPRDEEVLRAQPFHLLILDEAQAIKNAHAKVAKAIRRLDARHRLCLTGTPLENNLGELWAQFDFLMPGALGDARAFGRVFRAPIEKGGDPERRAQLAARVRPFILRRTKAAVAKELPPKTEVVHTVELQGAQRDLYETIRLSVHAAVQRAIATKGLDQAQIAILDALLKLRQACCDPRLVKLDAARDVTGSAKLDALLELLPELVEEGRRVLLFSQFTSMLALIEAALTERGIRFVKLTGQTRDRQTPVARFQNGEVPVFLISLKAGGTGLNLTAADTVIHYDPWWNPAAEQQATDRAHRIGQDKAVFVYKLIVAGSVEERIAGLQEHKRALAAGILDGEGRRGVALTRDDVEALLAPIE